ncbi:MAG: hypothetical protein IPK72_11865 [Candidatus Eisenbacteria bacterium]|nr:hypothetical protein [Candidatus Eisenbacteria bacterium]
MIDFDVFDIDDPTATPRAGRGTGTSGSPPKKGQEVIVQVIKADRHRGPKVSGASRYLGAIWC